MSVHYVLLPAATFLVTAALMAYVMMQRVRTALFSGLVAVLGSLLLWIAGMLLGSIAPPDSALATIGVIVHFAGVCAVASSFALLAMRFAQVSLVEENSWAASVAMSVPSALCFAMVISNPWHGLFGGPLDGTFFRATEPWPRGPLYGLTVAWVYLSSGAGLLACVRRAFLTHDANERRRLALITAGASVPLLAYAAQNAGWFAIPPEVPVATLSLTASALIVVVGVARYGFLDASLLPLRSVIDQIDDGLLLIDLEGTITETNPAALELVRIERATLVGSTLEHALQRLGDDGTVHRKLWQPIRSESQTERLESGGRAVDVSFGWLRGRHQERIGGFVVLGDRTEQQTHQRLRHRSQRLESMSVLLAGIAHEINNPLAYLRANLAHLNELAAEMEKTPADGARDPAAFAADLAEVVADSMEGLERIAAVISRTRSLAPRDAEPALGRVDLHALLARCTDLAQRYTRSDVELEHAFAPDLPAIEGFDDRLQQVFLNLLVNAIQAMGSRAGRVRVRTVVDADWVEVWVEDDGPGVPEPLRDRIFDPFFTTKDPDKGMGLGLSIVHDIVQEHGGELALDVSEWGGAAFRVRLAKPAPSKPDPIN